MSLIKSKQRVADHGEVFTPHWMVQAMLDLVKGETERIDSRFFAGYLNLSEADELYHAASHVLANNLVHGNALKMRKADGDPIIFAEWGYIGHVKFQRRDFRLDVLAGASSFAEEGSLFANLGKHEIFHPIGFYPPMKVGELAALDRSSPREAA